MGLEKDLNIGNEFNSEQNQMLQELMKNRDIIIDFNNRSPELSKSRQTVSNLTIDFRIKKEREKDEPNELFITELNSLRISDDMLPKIQKMGELDSEQKIEGEGEKSSRKIIARIREKLELFYWGPDNMDPDALLSRWL